jgi:phage repressor protein C with HTH and peptisase S24 domain
MVSPDPRQALVELCDQQGVSLAALSVHLGRNPSYLQQFVRKGSPRRLAETDRRRLATFFGVDESVLGAPEENSSVPEQASRRSEWIDVPRLALGASAGGGAMAGEEARVGSLRFANRWLREQGLEPGMLSAIAVAGDSMEPTLRDGDEILVDRTPRPLRDGIHVVRVEDNLLVKRVDTGRPGTIALVSDNPAYRPIELAPDEVAVIGRVVWKGGRL